MLLVPWPAVTPPLFTYHSYMAKFAGTVAVSLPCGQTSGVPSVIVGGALAVWTGMVTLLVAQPDAFVTVTRSCTGSEPVARKEVELDHMSYSVPFVISQ